MIQKNSISYKQLESSKYLKKIMGDHFAGLNRAHVSGNEKIAWCSSVGPVELLRSMGFLVYFPENHSAMLGASRKACDYIPYANRAGYSPDICSYLTSDIGAFLKGYTPLSSSYEGVDSVPCPDVLVYNTNQCRDVKDWFMWYSKYFKVPCTGIESFRNVDEVTVDHEKAIIAQLKSLVPVLENISGEKFDIDRFREIVNLSSQCSRLWKEILLTASNQPAPLTFFDATIHMGPAVVCRGTQEAVLYYKDLLAELKKRIADGIAAVENERFRLYWEGMPIWGRLKNLAEFFLDLDVCIAASTYCNSWIFSDLDYRNPFESMARAYTELFIVRSDTAKERYIMDMIDRYAIDGIIFHDAKTCPNNSNARYGMPRRLEDNFNIKTVVIDGDLNDLRFFSQEQTWTRLEVFMERLEATR